MGAMAGGDRPRGGKVVGAMPLSRPTGSFVMSIFAAEN